MKRIDGADGRTYITPVGKLPSVTSVLAVLAKPALIPWAANITASYMIDRVKEIVGGPPPDLDKIFAEAKKHHDQIRTAALDRGTLVHKAVDDWLIGATPTTTPETAEAIDKACRFLLKDLKFSPLKTDYMVYSAQHGYAGTLDALGDTPEGLTLLDLKTGADVYDEAYLQIAAYAMAYEEMFPASPKIARATILHIHRETGEPKPYSIGRRDIEVYAFRFFPLVQYYRATKHQQLERRAAKKAAKGGASCPSTE